MSIRLTNLQRQAVDHDEGPILVVAGPGSGKTRVLTERIRRLLSIENQHFRVLAVTFTNKAANEMSERLQDVPAIGERAFIGTLHSFCTEVLANRGKSVGINGMPNIFESYQDRKQILKEVVADSTTLKSALRDAGDSREQNRRLDEWLGEISEAKGSLLTHEMVQHELLGELYRDYDAALRRNNAIDFDDLLILTYRVFEERPNIASFYRRQYRYICIDEAQDLNEAQYRLICALCGKEFNNIMMVGDPKQAIFTWNGADPLYLDMFQQDFPGIKVELTENFRSSKAVVQAAKQLDANYRVDGQLAIEGEVKVTECTDEYEEAELIGDAIEELIASGHPDIEGSIQPTHFAIIGRNRFIFHEIEKELKSRSLPSFQKLTASGYQSETNVVQEFELALRILANPLDRLHLRALATRWGIENVFDCAYEGKSLREVQGMEVLVSLDAAADSDFHGIVFEAISKSMGSAGRLRLSIGLNHLEEIAADLDDAQRALILEDVASWRKHWDYFVRNQDVSSQNVQSFLSQLALGTTQQPNEEGIALLTVHSSKGMEFPIVFLIGMVEGVFPDYRAQQAAQLAEESRNAFVAVTRSQRLLFVTYPRQRTMPWGDVKRQRKSRFVAAIEQG